MIECVFCHSSFKSSFIFAECSHFFCLQCASIRWDGGYSLQCCEKTTYLAEQTVRALAENIKQKTPRDHDEKENRQTSEYSATLQKSKQEKDYVQSKLQGEIRESSDIRENVQAVMISSYESQQLLRRDQSLRQMEKVLSDQMAQVKCDYESYCRQIEMKHQMLLKELYNTYSEHLQSLKKGCSSKDVVSLRQKLSRVAQFASLSSGSEENRQDKILSKLDYNHQKMKEKLNKHYELLK